MKKFLSAVIALVLAVGAQAQIVSSNSSSIKVVETKKEKKTTYYLRGGLNFANLSGDYTDDYDTAIGYELTMGFHKAMGDLGLFWGMEWGLGTRGCEADFDGEEETISAHKVEFVPFQFGYKYNFDSNWALSAQLGAYISYDYSGTYEYDGEESDLDDLDGYEALDYGLKYGISVYYSRFFLSLTGQSGLNPMFSYSDDDIDMEQSTSNFMLSVGMTF